MWILQLNPMPSNAENIVPVAWAETKEELEQLLQDEKVESYRDGDWYKSFKQGGPLEWYNPPSEVGDVWIDVPAMLDVGSCEDWIQDTINRYNQLKLDLVSA